MTRVNVLNILIAEDNPDDVFLLGQAFNKAAPGHRLQAVSDGLETLAYLKGESTYADRKQYPFPDILLLDLNMPRMNGFEVLEWVRRDPQCSQLMVHVLTASPRAADVQRAYGLGANSYLVKPSRMDELVALATAVDQWHRFIHLVECPIAKSP